MSLNKADGSVLVGVPSLDALSERFEVKEMEHLYGGMTQNLKSKSDVELFDRIWAVDFPESMGLKNVQAAYAALPEVEEVRLVDICKMYDAYLPNDVVTSQYYLRNMSVGGADIHAVGAWNQSLGDSNIIVAVADSGVDWHHPDLGGTHPDKVNGALWTNWTEYYGTAGVDDDGNGFIDDFRGWDFMNVPQNQGWPDEDVTTADNDPMDYESHGTNCAGCVAAITNNGIGIAGTAPGCKVMALRVGYLQAGQTGGVVRMDYVAQGFVYAMNNGASIINCSWGSSSYLRNSANAAKNAGLLLITAAGNDNDTVASYLATDPGVIAVAATDQNDYKSSFSSFGSWVEASAPGVSIFTTNYNRIDQSHGYASVNGTSFSSPITCGAAALLWSANPGMTAQQISALLLNNTDSIDYKNPTYAGQLGSGRINMLKALGDNEHRYPEEFPTLFDAMNSSGSGDVVAIEGGLVIAGPVTIQGGDYQILGGYNSDYSSRDPLGNPTIIEGNPANPALKFLGDVENTTIMDGFLVRNGQGSNFSGIPYSGKAGGGIQLNHTSPTLRNFEVTSNSVGSNSTLGLGGGILANDSHAVLDNVYIHGNEAVFGAGLFANNSSLTLIDCTIEDNTIITDNLGNDPLGGGIHMTDSTIHLTNCTVSGHSNCINGGGIYSDDNGSITMVGGSISNNTAATAGAGIYHIGGSVTLTGTELSGNTRDPAATFMSGGGIYVENSIVSLDSLTVSNNTAHTGAGASFKDCSQADVAHSVFAGNTAQFFGGAVYYQNTAAGTLTSNTIVENDATFSGGGGVFVQGATPDFSNNLIALNTGGVSFANGVATPGEPAVFNCNDVFGNANADYSGMADPTGSNGNVMADPLFCNLGEANYNVTTDSPCDADNSAGCGLIGALGSGCGISAIPDPDNGIPLVFQVEQNFPNPFNPSTTIRFALPASAHTQVVVYDLAGRKVKTLVDGLMPAQIHSVVWSGRDDAERSVSAGVYFYRVTSGDHFSVGRMALVK